MGGGSSLATLHIPHFGQACFHVDGQRLTIHPGTSAINLPGLARRAETTLWAGLSLGLNPQRLAATAAELAGDPDARDRFLPSFLQPLLFDQADPLTNHLFDHLRRVVALIDLEPSRSFVLPASLPLDRMIERAVAVLTCPELATR